MESVLTINQPHGPCAQPPTGAPVPAFGVAVARRRGVAVVRLSGELDLGGVAELTACAGQLPVAGAVEVDLRALSFLDSTGLTALVDLYGVLTGRGCTVRLLGPQGRVLHLLDVAADAGWLFLPLDCPQRPDWAIVSPQAAAS